MMITNLVLLAFAFVCFVLSTFNVQAKYNLTAAGLALLTAGILFSGLKL